MKRNLIFAFTAGLASGVFLIPTLKSLELSFSYEYPALLAGLPLLSVLGVFVAAKIGERIGWVFQVAKFGLTGALNATIDFGVLNILILLTSISAGIYFSIFKTLSFIAANFNSYFWNKYWTFENREEIGAGEYVKFLIVSIGGLILNVGIASLVVNFVDPRFGASPALWANIGAVVGVAGNLFWNFFGYKFVVFKK